MVLPRQQDLGGRAGLHGELGAHRDGVAQADRPLRRGHAHTPFALPAEDLRALAGGIAQRKQHRAGGGDQAVFAGGRSQLDQPAAQDKPALNVAADQPVVDQGQRQTMDSRPREPGSGHQLGQCCGPGLQCIQHHGCLIDDSDAA
jgi:hypothetical protein